ncbi:unnamed protein product, partial [Ectocarpus sp. 4 AP-2014]
MAMATAGKPGGGFNVDHVLDFEKRSGIKDGEIESFITKVNAVNAAIQAMKARESRPRSGGSCDGELDPADVHVDGVPTIEEERQMEEEKRRKRLELARREQENRERQKRQENEKWWSGAELLYGERKRRSGATAVEESRTSGCGNARDGEKISPSIKSLSEVERLRLKERYSMEYSRWDTWTPTDPATLAEAEEREEEEDRKRTKEFEENNPQFCKEMVDDMKTRSEARLKKDSEATTARLKGNRFYKAKRWEKALELYMTSLRARPYAVNTLANVAQTLIKLERWLDAVEFCDRALHVDGKCVKAFSRRASAFVKLAEDSTTSGVAAAAAPATISPPSDAVDGTVTQTEVVIKGCTSVSIDVSDLPLVEDETEAVSGTEGDGESSGRGEEHVFRVRFGGREGLMAIALLDLHAAVEADPDSEDIRRQRDSLSKEIEEEQAEAAVMKMVKGTSGTYPSRSSSGVSETEIPNLGTEGLGASADENQAQDVTAQPRDTRARTIEWRTEALSGLPLPDGKREEPTEACKGNTSIDAGALGDENDLHTVDKILEEVLGGVKVGAKGLEATRLEKATEGAGTTHQRHLLLRLTSILEDNPTARVYFRASGGLARLTRATATAAAAAAAAAGASRPDQDVSKTSTRASTSSSLVLPQARGAEGMSAGAIEDGGCDGDGDVPSGGVDGDKDPVRFASMLVAVSAAIKGGERLAQQEVFKSGLLGDPCADAMRRVVEEGAEGMVASTGAVAAAGAAALLLSRAIDDVSVRAYVARRIDLLAGLVDIVGAGSMSPLDVEAAADTLCVVLIGRTAPIAAKTLSSEASSATSVSTEAGLMEQKRLLSCPATAVGRALLAWKEGSGPMKDAPASTGFALCNVLANLAMNENFRESFAKSYPSKSMGGGVDGGGDSTVASVLILVARDMKADRSEARSVALAALVNACLHNHSVQKATLAAGGLAFALATLSLEGKDRVLHVPPLVAARSAGLLARLSPLPEALEAMARPGVVDRIIQATVRSSTLGGDLYTTVTRAKRADDAADDLAAAAATEAAAISAANATERENLVRVLGSILRSKPPAHTAACDDARRLGSPAPSSNVPGVTTIKDAKDNTVATAGQLKLSEALISFLPPAREDGTEGVTATSVSLRPKWLAPPAVTGNVCVCLLHLLDGEGSGHIATQVIFLEAGG